jgi:hypothetical protein
MHVRWTRAELRAVRDAIDLTPSFDGRPVVREAVRRTLRMNGRDVTLELTLAQRLAAHLVPVDMPTTIAKVKLLRAIRDARRMQAPLAGGAEAA